MAKQAKLMFGSNTTENRRKLRELILYVVSRCSNDPRFGAIKLNKILYYVDFYAFGWTGKSVTGSQYQRLPNGPAPKHLVPVRDEMIEKGELETGARLLLNGEKQTRFSGKRPADVSLFTSRELALVQEVIDSLEELTAKEVSDKSHGRAWKNLPDGTLIPYQAVFISERELVPDDVKVIRMIGARYNWRERIMKRRGSAAEI